MRCAWSPRGDPLYVAYHDEEWGVPSRDPFHLFEMLVLEGAQAGLSWSTILHKREGYRRAFAGFDPARWRGSTPRCSSATPGIVRNRLKVESSISNARVWLEQDDPVELLWSFVGGKPKRQPLSNALGATAQTPESAAMSKELKRRGFRFVGPTICYSLMQACGLVDDHTTDCFRYGAASAGAPCRARSRRSRRRACRPSGTGRPCAPRSPPPRGPARPGCRRARLRPRP